MTDVFRKVYKQLNDEQKDYVVKLKEKAQELWNLYDECAAKEYTDKRMIDIAKTNLETASMWAVKSVT